MPKLLLKFEAAVIKEVPVGKNPISVGRNSDNDIVLESPEVSGRHCRISSFGDIFFVEDLSSTNGTYVNGKKITKTGLRHNDVIGIVKHSLVFMDERADAPKQDDQSDGPNLMPEPAITVGTLQVTTGVVTRVEFELTELSTYMGKSERVTVPIKGSGIFGSAPEVAAMITRRPEGYFIVAIKEGYPTLNGTPITKKEQLKDGDIITAGSTTFRFSLKKK